MRSGAGSDGWWSLPSDLMIEHGDETQPLEIRGNAWRSVPVPDLGTWEPALQVSVVLPFYESQDALAITLAALSEQSYPRELLEIIVADDGSSPPARIPPGLDDVARVLWQEDRGFGLARARNLGAREARGDVLVFLDCDMVPEQQTVEAHARWHHLLPYAVTVGSRVHVEMEGVNPSDVAAAVREDDLDALFADREVQRPEWIEGHLVRTDELTSDDDDLFRVASGGNLGVRREFYWDVGGSDESFTQWGAEDTELGFRLFTAGGLFVAERRAMCWHQGHGHEPSEDEQRSLDQQRAKLAHLVAHRSFREAGGRSYLVPRVVVRVDASGTDGRSVGACVGSVLASDMHDLVVQLVLPPDHGDAVWLERQYGPDPRVDVGPDLDPARDRGFSPVVIELPAQAAVATTAVSEIVRRLEDRERPCGVLHATVEGMPPGEAMVLAYRRRALARAVRVMPGDDLDGQLAVAGRLFGEEWLAGGDLGITVAVTSESPRAMGGSVRRDDLEEVWKLFSTLEPEQRAQVLSLARTVLTRLPRRVLVSVLGLAMRVLRAVRRVVRVFRR